MDAIFANLPPVTKGWTIATITTSILITTHKVKPINLLFFPDKAWTSQNWRLVTTFCTFGELSFDLVFMLWLISSSCRKIENEFHTRFSQMPLGICDSLTTRQQAVLNDFISRNKHLDFFYFFIQVSLSILFVATWLHYKMEITLLELGAVLCQSFVYMDSKMSPNEPINFFGFFQFNNVYYPYFSVLITFLSHARLNDSNNGFPNSRGSSNNDAFSIFKKISQLFHHPLFWFYFVSYGLGHFWWCCREFILGGFHYDDNETGRRLRNQTLRKYGIKKFDIIREFLVILLLPPWYWVILSKIKQDPR